METSDDEGQDRRTRVEMAFVEEGAAAIERYKLIWSKKNDAATKGDVIEMLAIAGLLLEHDRARYGEYYRYINEHLKSNDTEILGSALAALCDAVGAESIEVLVDAASGNRPRVAAEALAALEYRLRTSRADAALAADLRLINLRSEKLCSRVDNELIKNYCDRNFVK